MLITDIYNTGTTNVTTTTAPVPNVILNTGTLIWKAINLPIELAYFQTEQANDNNLITWQTSSEINNNYFTLEHSTTNTNYTLLAIINGYGTTDTQINYSYLDIRPSEGINYYRLSQTDYNGTTTIIQVSVCIFLKKTNTLLGIIDMSGNRITTLKKPGLYIFIYSNGSKKILL